MGLPFIKNVQIDDHPEQGDEYLVDVQTGPAGDYYAESFDPNNVMRIRAKVTQDGNYSVKMYDAHGNYSHTIHNAHKHAACSHSSSVTTHKYEGVGGGKEENHGAGHFTQTVATRSHATAGPHVHAANSTHMHLSPQGSGIHAVKGDQTMTVVEGGMYWSVDKGFSVNAKGSHGVSCDGDHMTTTKGSTGFVSSVNMSMYAANCWCANVGGVANIISTTSSVMVQIGQANVAANATSILLQIGNISNVTVNTSGVFINGPTVLVNGVPIT